MALDKKSISFEFTAVTIQLFPKFVIEVSEIIDKYLNEKKLRHSQTEPGHFIIHPDQPQLAIRLTQLHDEIKRLETIEGIFKEAGLEKEEEKISQPVIEEKTEKSESKPLPKRKGK